MPIQPSTKPYSDAYPAQARPASWYWLVALLMAWFSFNSARARAEITACVSNASELSQQFLLAQASNQDLVLKVVQGFYDLDNSALVSVGFLFPQSVRILGGYTSACASRVVNPANTVFFSFANSKINWRSRGRLLEFEGITFNGPGTQISLASIPQSEVDFTVTLRRNVFQNYVASSGNIEARVEISFYHHEGSNRRTRVENNLFHHNTAPTMLDINGYDPDFTTLAIDASVVNNTLVDNQAQSGICVKSLVFPTLANNIVLGHEYDLDSTCVIGNAAPPRLFHNTYATRRVNTPLVDLGSSAVSPIFVDPPNFNYRAQSSSVTVNSGSSASIVNLPSLDIEGNVRFQGVAPDRGAYENANTGLFVQTVTNTNNAGSGSLRQALLNANGTPGLNAVFFDIPGACPHSINLTTALPIITESVTLDAFTQPGSIPNESTRADDATRCVIVRPTNAGSIARGFYSQTTPGSGVRLGVIGMAMGGFSTSAIELVGGGAHFVQGSQFGGTVGGVVLPSNATNIAVGASDGSRIGGTEDFRRNVIGGATVAGVALELANDNSIINNLIGVAPNGQTALPNAIGVRLNAASRNLITDNVISGNGNGIVALSPSGFFSNANLIGGNLIGLRAVPLFAVQNGDALGNEFNGVLVYGNDNVVGECLHASNGQSVIGVLSNTIAYNGITTSSAGVNVRGGRGNCIAGNRVYKNNSGNLAQQIDVGVLGIDTVDNDSAVGTDALSNRGINAPVLLSATGTAAAGSAVIRLQSRAGIYRLLVYSGVGCGSVNAQGEARDFHVALNTSISATVPSEDGVTQFTVPLQTVGTQTSLIGRGIVAQVQRSPNPITEPADSSELGACVVYTDDGTLFRNGFE